MATERSMGYMLQGVSQQSPDIRPDGKVTEQINRLSDPVLGNTSRPAGKRVGLVQHPLHASRNWHYVVIGGVEYLITVTTSISDRMRVFGLDGTEYEVNYASDAARTYVGDDMVFYVYDDVVYCSNREKVVALSPDVPTANRQNEAVVRLFGGTLGQRYSVKIIDGAGSYEAKTKCSETDIDTTNGELIAQELLNDDGEDSFTDTVSLNSALPAHYSVSRHGTHLRIVNTNGNSFDIQVTDNGAEDTIVAVSKEIKDIGDLPIYAAHGMYVKIIGEESNDDDYYMRFEVTDYDGAGADFGKSGTWVETTVAGEPYKFDLTTMPHTLAFDSETSEFTLSPGEWRDREAGDNESCPPMDFVGQRIRDIKEFQSRLHVCAGPYECLSKSEEPLVWWQDSATQQVDTDPISMRSAKSGTVEIDWLVPFDRDMIGICKDAQLYVDGDTKITPDNAAMVVTTSYTTSTLARPCITGKTILIPFIQLDTDGLQPNNSGILEFITTAQSTSNEADPITATLSSYISGEVDMMASAPSSGIALMRATASKKVIYVYQYLWENSEKKQSAWHKWEFKHDVKLIFERYGIMHVVLDHGDFASICSINPNKVKDAVGYHVTLDDRELITVTGRTCTVWQDDPVFVGVSGVADAGEKITPISEVDNADGSWTYTFGDWQLDASAVMYVGNEIHRELHTTMPVHRDYQNRPVPNALVVVSHFIVVLSDSGNMGARMVCKWRTNPWDIQLSWIPTSDDSLDPDMQGTRDGQWLVPWGEAASRSQLIIYSDDFRPDTVQEVLWRGQIRKKGGR